MNDKIDSLEPQAIHHEIAELERRLQDAKARLNGHQIQKEATPDSPSKLLTGDGIARPCHSVVPH
jgi:hypothetical protein